MTQTPYEKVFEQTAHRLGLSVGELRQRLEMERATRGPGGRDIMHDVWQDHRRPVVGPAWVLPSSGPSVSSWDGQRGSGWVSPRPLASPPGQAYIEQLCNADSERQRLATPEGRRAKVKELVAQAEGMLAEGLGDRERLEALIEDGRRILGA
jgi:hypothetical protein